MKTNGAKKQMIAPIVSNYEPQHNEMETHTPFILIPADVFQKVNVMLLLIKKTPFSESSEEECFISENDISGLEVFLRGVTERWLKHVRNSKISGI